jgi:hypothetical protein
LTDEKGRPMTYWGGAASPDKKHGGSPLTEHEIAVLREEMLSDDGFLPEGKERVARLCDMALASIAPSAGVARNDDGQQVHWTSKDGLGEWQHQVCTLARARDLLKAGDRVIAGGEMPSATGAIPTKLDNVGGGPYQRGFNDGWNDCVDRMLYPPDRTMPEGK